MIRPTKTGAMFLAVSVLLYISSLTSQSSLLLVPIGILLGCAIVNVFLAWKTVSNLEVQPSKSVHVGEGEKISQPWKLFNRGKTMAGLARIESRGNAILSLRTLLPKVTANIVPEMVFQQRGIHIFSEMKLTSIYPFGLIKAVRRLNLPGEVVVYPAIYPASAPRAAGYDVMIGGKYKGKRRIHTGTHFAGVRPFQSGDSLKQIHWTSSAKGQGLMVKTFEEELSGRVTIIMDAGNSGDTKVFDDCVRATGSLIFASLDAGDHVEWIDLANRELLLIPPFADGGEILDRLARITGQPNCLTEKNIQMALERISRKSAICFILTEFNQAAYDAISELEKQRRQVSVYLPEKYEDVLIDAPVFRYAAQSISEVK